MPRFGESQGEISDTGDFSARLNVIIGHRRPFSWAAALKITSGTMNRLTKGHVPGGDLLARIAQVENASITWLLTGQGEPFLVHRTDSDAETAERLRAHLADEPWDVDLIEDGRRGVIVLTQRAQLGEGEEAVHYTAMELIAGPWGEETAGILHRHARFAGRVQSAVIDEAWHGRIGTHEMLDIIEAAHKAAQETPDLATMVAEVSASYGGGAYSPDERAWVDAYHRLSPASRTHARAVVDALAQSADERKRGNGGE